MPYPILKEQGKYPSVVNYSPSDVAIDDENEHRNEGRKLTNMGGTGTNAGKLAVTIEMGSGGAVYEGEGPEERSSGLFHFPEVAFVCFEHERGFPVLRE